MGDGATPEIEAARAEIDALDARCDHAATRDGEYEVRWRLKGDGPPLVLLHGGYGSWMHWLRVIEPLAERWRVACPDMPGFAESGGREPRYDPPKIAEALARGSDEMFGDAAGVAIAGFSFGGLVAGHLARRLGPRASMLWLIGSGGLGADRPGIAMTSRRRDMSEAELREANRRNLAALMFKNAGEIDEVAVEIQTRNTSRRPTIVTANFSRTPALAEILPDVTCPVAAIWGDGDATVGPFFEKRLQTLRAGAPVATATVIPDCGHWAMYERPEAVVEALAATLPA